MTFLNAVKAGAVLSAGVMYFAACNRAIKHMQIPALQKELDNAEVLGKQLDREIDKQIK